jgi:hypothetical protein
MTRYTWLHIISILVNFASAIIQFSYISMISKKFIVMKLRFSKKKESRRKKCKNFRRLESIYCRDTINTNQHEEEKKEEVEELGNLSKSDDVTDFILAKTNENDVPDWGDLSFSDKIRIFNEWSIVLLISNALIFIGSIFMMITGVDVNREAEILLGLGAMLSCFALPINYENVKGYNIITNTISNSSSILAKAVLGILPVYIGF